MATNVPRSSESIQWINVVNETVHCWDIFILFLWAALSLMSRTQTQCCWDVLIDVNFLQIFPPPSDAEKAGGPDFCVQKRGLEVKLVWPKKVWKPEGDPRCPVAAEVHDYHNIGPPFPPSEGKVILNGHVLVPCALILILWGNVRRKDLHRSLPLLSPPFLFPIFCLHFVDFSFRPWVTNYISSILLIILVINFIKFWVFLMSSSTAEIQNLVSFFLTFVFH